MKGWKELRRKKSKKLVTSSTWRFLKSFGRLPLRSSANFQFRAPNWNKKRKSSKTSIDGGLHKDRYARETLIEERKALETRTAAIFTKKLDESTLFVIDFARNLEKLSRRKPLLDRISRRALSAILLLIKSGSQKSRWNPRVARSASGRRLVGDRSVEVEKSSRKQRKMREQNCLKKTGKLRPNTEATAGKSRSKTKIRLLFYLRGSWLFKLMANAVHSLCTEVKGFSVFTAGLRGKSVSAASVSLCLWGT